MMDVNIGARSDALPIGGSLVGGSDAHLAERVSIEADRLAGTLRDGVEAAQAASETYGSLLTDTSLRVIQGSVRSSVEVGHHVLALLQARTPADVFALNVAFMQRQMASVHERLFDMAGVSEPSADGRRRHDGQA